jgi:hypothetical protein
MLLAAGATDTATGATIMISNGGFSTGSTGAAVGSAVVIIGMGTFRREGLLTFPST